MNARASVVRRALRAPVTAAHGETTERELVLFEVGQGLGEAAPLSSYDGVELGDVLDALADCREPLGSWDGDPATRADVLAACARRTALPQALAAVDLALWDHCGRVLGAPVWRLLGAPRAPVLEVNATIGAMDPHAATVQASAAAAAGFATLKVKVGAGDDAARVAAVRAAVGPEIAIRLDANGAWSVEQALATLRAVEAARVELCEEPVHGLEAIGAVAAGTSVPVALDESAALPGALDRRACAAVCLKVARSGGITGLLRDAGKARRCGYQIYLASTLDGPLGVAAALHAAAALPGGPPERASGLATLAMFEQADPLAPSAGRLTASEAAGLGDDRLRAWYR